VPALEVMECEPCGKLYGSGSGERCPVCGGRMKSKNMGASSSKMHNETMHCMSGHWHQSKVESRYCDSLLAAKQSKQILDYKVQVKYELKVNDCHIANHIVDFEVISSINGRETKAVHEVKGFETPEWLIKMRLFKALFPDIPYIVYRQADTFSKGASKWPKRKLRGGRQFKRSKSN